MRVEAFLKKNGIRWLALWMAMVCLLGVCTISRSMQARADGENSLVWDAEGYAVLTSEAEALEYVRDQFKQRVPVFKVDLRFEGVEEYDLQMLLRRACGIMPGCAPDEGDYIYYQLGGTMVYYFESTPFRWEVHQSYYDTYEQEQEVTQKVEDILEHLDLEKKSDYGKVKSIYDWILQNIAYNYEELNNGAPDRIHSAHAALVLNNTVCQGYALAMVRLCREVGVEARYVPGEVPDGPHAWVWVKLGERWYFCDPTWDAGGHYYRYFLRLPDSMSQHQGVPDSIWGENLSQAYPTASTDNTMLREIQNYGNFSTSAFSFPSIDGTVATTEATGRPKLLIFFEHQGSDSLSTLGAISQSEWIRSGAVDVVALDMGGAKKSEWEALLQTESASPVIQFGYGEDVDAAKAAYQARVGTEDTAPLVIMVDRDGYIRYGMYGAIEDTALYSTYIPNLIAVGNAAACGEENPRALLNWGEITFPEDPADPDDPTDPTDPDDPLDSQIVLGDATGDGTINGLDVVRLKKYLANYDYATQTSTVAIAIGFDPNGDDKVTSSDAVRLRKYLANYDYGTHTSTILLGKVR